MIPRYRIWHEKMPSGPFVADARSYDVPNTIGAMIRNVVPNCVAITLRPLGGEIMIATAEREARRRNMRIIWVPRRAALGRPR